MLSFKPVTGLGDISGPGSLAALSKLKMQLGVEWPNDSTAKDSDVPPCLWGLYYRHSQLHLPEGFVW